MRIRKDYPPTGVLKRCVYSHSTSIMGIVDQEGLPAYWGIETSIWSFTSHIADIYIRKDYPPTGVLKPNRPCSQHCFGVLFPHQEGLPAYWGIETLRQLQHYRPRPTDQEGLPAYWGIETLSRWRRVAKFVLDRIRKDYPPTGVLKLIQLKPVFTQLNNQEGLPAYWGIETWPIRRAISLCKRIIRKDYLTTEVLKCLLVDGNTEMTSKIFWIAAKTLPR